MTPTPIKVFFRRKNGKSTWTAFTTVRVPGRAYPMQVHLCYLPERPEIAAQDLEYIEVVLKQKWLKHFGSELLELDRADAAAKWARRGQVREKVDRATALEQITLWLNGKREILPAFRREGFPIIDETDSELLDFAEGFIASHRLIDVSQAGIDASEVAVWWEREEAPRLLFRYFEYVRRKKWPFTAHGFLQFLTHHIWKKWPRYEMMRRHRHRSLETHRIPEFGSADPEAFNADDAVPQYRAMDSSDDSERIRRHIHGTGPTIGV